ncbi:ATP-grasp domain-containing protein [Streptomyces beigongshangae]|uniref:ATP-grasp domain-containing protein n=1 Tax=Streptomyces beigongshangae TaxID=2841597 RepID=UPI0021A91B73|nr:RimK family alpha-L-glutamate ligase [Streptomyces sp. REN17]
MRSTTELADALGAAYGERFAVWRSDELVLGVRGGRLTLCTLGGIDVAVPKVVCVRQVPGSMRHDREISLLRHLEHMGTVLVNPLDAHVGCRNKLWQLQELAVAGLPVPDTVSYATAPPEGVVRVPGLETPCVVKSVTGMQGRQVFLVPDRQLLCDVVGALAQEVPVLFQEYVQASRGRHLRVVVIDGEPVAAGIRTSPDGAFASNIMRGGSGEVCTGRFRDAEALAVEATRTMGLVIAGVDLLFTSVSPDTFTICEVNAVPGWRPEMAAVVPAIVDCIARRLDQRANPPFPQGEQTTEPFGLLGGA